MNIVKRSLIFGCLLLLAAGCSTVTNLTASRQPRNNNNLYMVEASLESNQQSMIRESVRAYLLVGMDEIPMDPVPVVKNRWQGYLPVPAGSTDIRYRFKFVYAYYDIPVTRTNSILSQEYKLILKDK